MGHMRWPPRFVRTDVLGEVIDSNGRHPKRDIGRPVFLGSSTYYSFGDTFCHDRQGKFHGVTDSTLAYVPDPVHHPTRCYYIHDKDLVDNFIPHTQSEVEYFNHPDNKRDNNRVGCGSFGGWIEDRDGSGTGWATFDKMYWHGAKGGHQFGTAVARVILQPDKSVRMDRIMGDEMLFGTNDPRFGSQSMLLGPDNWVYLLGSHEVALGSLDMRNHLARIRRNADFTRRSNYQFWLKTNRSDNHSPGTWQTHYTDINDFKKLGQLDTQLQGSLLYVPGFAPRGRPYVWIGVNKFGRGNFYVGSAPEVTGPWEVCDMGALPDDPGERRSGEGMKYCLFANERASDLGRGEMLCTWTDAATLGGKVVAAKFWFEGEYVRGPPPLPPQGGSRGGLVEKMKGKMEGFLR